MAKDPKRRQKALAKKAAKRKAKKEVARPAPPGSLVSRSLRALYPIHECLVPAHLFDRGIGTVVVSRSTSRDDIVWAGFLLDVWCLGVKDAFARIEPEASYDTSLEDVMFREDLVPVEPAYAKKLIVGAAAYAHDLGFSPHADYREASRILAPIDVSTCDEVFTFGREGKPFFASGPYDTRARCRRVLAALEQRCGHGNFDFLVNGFTGDGGGVAVSGADVLAALPPSSYTEGDGDDG